MNTNSIMGTMSPRRYRCKNSVGILPTWRNVIRYGGEIAVPLGELVGSPDSSGVWVACYDLGKWKAFWRAITRIWGGIVSEDGRFRPYWRFSCGCILVGRTFVGPRCVRARCVLLYWAATLTRASGINWSNKTFIAATVGDYLAPLRSPTFCFVLLPTWHFCPLPSNWFVLRDLFLNGMSSYWLATTRITYCGFPKEGRDRGLAFYFYWRPWVFWEERKCASGACVLARIATRRGICSQVGPWISLRGGRERKGSHR